MSLGPIADAAPTNPTTTVAAIAIAFSSFFFCDWHFYYTGALPHSGLATSTITTSLPTNVLLLFLLLQENTAFTTLL